MPGTVHRVVTKTNEAGKAVILSSDDVAIQSWPNEANAGGGTAGGVVVWSTEAVPADNTDADVAGGTRDQGVTLKGGSVFWVTEMGPGYESPMHRTLSIDYCMVLSGAIEVTLDGGDTFSLAQGDALVQRGTSHFWRNPSQDTPCRLLVCMIESRPIAVGGQVLQAFPT